MESLMSFDIVCMNDISPDPSLATRSLVEDGSLDNSLSTAELNRHLEHLLAENKELKENMEKKNKMVVELLSKIASWQEKMAETNSEHRSMLVNSVEENQILKEKIKQLESAIADSKCEMTQLAEETEKLRKKLEDQQIVHQKWEDAAKKNETLTEETKKLRKELEDRQIVHQKWEDAAKKNETLMVAIQELTEEKQKLSENLQNQQTVHQEAVKELKCELENLQLKCQQVENEKIALDVQNIEIDQHQTFADLGVLNQDESMYAVYMQSAGNEKKFIQNLIQLLQEKDKKIESLSGAQKQLEDEKEASASLQLKLTEVEEKLSANVAELEECKNSTYISVLERKLEELTEDNNCLKQLLDDHEAAQIEENEELSSVKELLQHQDIEQLDNLTARLLTAEEELAAEREKVEALNQKARDQVDHSNDEALQLLKAQVESYKSEYEAEVCARKGAQQAVEKLTNMLKTVKEQVERSRHHGSRRHRRKHTSESTSAPELPSISSHIQERTVTCPGCHNPFAPDALEDHMRGCVDNFS